MSSTSKSKADKKRSEAAKRTSEAVKRIAPILERETSKTRNIEWFRYGAKIEKISSLITGFKLTDEQVVEMKATMSVQTSQQLSRDSVCIINALDVNTNKWCNVAVKRSKDKLILDWTHCTGCEVGKTIDFDFKNSFWEDDNYTGCDVIFYTMS